jgi:hypothetical protein
VFLQKNYNPIIAGLKTFAILAKEQPGRIFLALGCMTGILEKDLTYEKH